MRSLHLQAFLIAVITPFTLPSCKAVECGPSTIEVDGACVPSNESTSDAKCGPFTELVGDVCVPMFPPTVCDPATTLPDLDTSTNVTTCVGTGEGGGCESVLPCPTPTSGKQTLCGQIYDFVDQSPFAAPGATGALCDPGSPAADGPCSLSIRAFDAIAFAADPTMATPLPTDEVYIDDCGRYRVPNITVPSGPFVGLGIDDASMSLAGPMGTTNTIGIATPKKQDMSIRDVEAFIATKATTDMWTDSGGPPMSGGIYAMMFRSNRPPSLTSQAGVQVLRAGAMITGIDHYFDAAEVTRQTIDMDASVTGVNGTALITNTGLMDGIHTGDNTNLPMECIWSSHNGAALANILFVQVVRPVDAFGQTCPL